MEDVPFHGKGEELDHLAPFPPKPFSDSDWEIQMKRNWPSFHILPCKYATSRVGWHWGEVVKIQGFVSGILDSDTQEYSDREKVLRRQTIFKWRQQGEDFITERKMSCFSEINGQMHLSPTKWSSWNAVSQASGMAAAWIKVISLGIGIRRPSGTVTNWAWPPPGSRAITASPILQRPEQPGPSSATLPAASRPKMSLAPLGGG